MRVFEFIVYSVLCSVFLEAPSARGPVSLRGSTVFDQHGFGWSCVAVVFVPSTHLPANDVQGLLCLLLCIRMRLDSVILSAISFFTLIIDF